MERLGGGLEMLPEFLEYFRKERVFLASWL